MMPGWFFANVAAAASMAALILFLLYLCCVTVVVWAFSLRWVAVWLAWPFDSMPVSCMF
eukprot:SAG25_NODE_13812_length_262_cov_1.263804_1_plen_58_part_10